MSALVHVQSAASFAASLCGHFEACLVDEFVVGMYLYLTRVAHFPEPPRRAHCLASPWVRLARNSLLFE